MNRYRFATTLLILLFVIAAAACDSGSSNSGSTTKDPVAPTVGDPAHTDPAGADLSEVALAQGEAQPLDRFAVTGLPEGIDIGDVYVRFYTLSGEIESIEVSGERLLPLYEIDDAVYLPVPLLDPEGSSIVLVVTDGSSHSEAFELIIAPLPAPRVGAVDDLQAATERLLKASTEALDKEYPAEWEHWRDNMTQMPQYLLPLMESWLAVADPDNEMAAVNQDLDEAARTLLERILAARPMIEAINAQAAHIESGDSTLSSAADTLMMRTSSTHGTAAMSRSPQSGSDQAQIAGLEEISTAGQLAPLLKRYRDARHAQQDLELFDETVGTYLTGVAALGSLPSGGRGGQLISASRLKVVEYITNGTTVLSGSVGMANWFLPCCITQLTTTLDPADGHIATEDADANQVKLVDARARAQSEPTPMTRKQMERIFDGMQKATGASTNETVAQLYGETAAALITDYSDTSAAEQYRQFFPPDADMVFYWNNIDMMAGEPQRWLEAESDTLGSGTAILTQAATGPERMEFALKAPEAFARQDSLLRFKTNFDELPTAIAGQTRPIHLNYIRVIIEPARIQLTDDDVTVPFTVRLENSELNSSDIPHVILPLELEPEFGEIEFMTIDDSKVLHFNYHAPDEFPEGATAQVRIEAKSDSGIRAPGNNPPPRTASLIITEEPAPVQVKPGTVCLDSGETQQFQAIDPVTGEASDVTWSAAEGSVSSSGLYTAPGGTGGNAVLVTAKTATSSASAVVVLADCSCYWDASLEGDIFGSDGRAGEVAGLVLMFEEENGYTGMQFISDGQPTTFLTFELDTSVPFGSGSPTTRTAQPYLPWTLSGQQFGLQPGQEGDTLPPRLPGLNVQITKREPLAGSNLFISMDGRIHGQVVYPQPGEGNRYGDLDVNFSGVFSVKPPGSTLNCQALF